MNLKFEFNNMDHKELDVWKESMKLTALCYEISAQFPSYENYVLKQQFLRSAISIPSNIAEGSGRKSDVELMRFLNIALGSLAELETQYLIACQQNYFEKTVTFENQFETVRKLILGFRNYIKNKNS